MPTYLRLLFKLAPNHRPPRSGSGDPRAGPDRDRLAAPGPLIRRVLGKAMVESFCTFGKPYCQPSAPSASTVLELCSLAEACPYGVLFAASRSRRPPFALFVPNTADGPLTEVEWTLFGPACRFYAWAAVALQRALWDGLGRERTSFQILDIRRVGGDGRSVRLCGGDLARLPSALTPDFIDLAAPSAETGGPLAVDFLSPTRLLKDKKMVWGSDPVPFDLLVARILGRLGDLFGEEADGVPSADARAEILRRASEVPILQHRTEWREVHDYSARSRSDLLLGGKVGRVVYAPASRSFLGILRVGEVLQVGKNTASGCGRIRVG